MCMCVWRGGGGVQGGGRCLGRGRGTKLTKFKSGCACVCGGGRLEGRGGGEDRVEGRGRGSKTLHSLTLLKTLARSRFSLYSSLRFSCTSLCFTSGRLLYFLNSEQHSSQAMTQYKCRWLVYHTTTTSDKEFPSPAPPSAPHQPKPASRKDCAEDTGAH